MRGAQYWIDALELEPLPEEGGWYREGYRAAEAIERVRRDRMDDGCVQRERNRG